MGTHVSEGRSGKTSFSRFLAAFALGATLLVSACGGGKEDDLPPGEETVVTPEGVTITRSARDQRAIDRRERLRQQAAEENEADFTYFSYYIDTDGDSPEACFVFSAALDPELDYSPYVEFRPTFRPALKVEGRELCVGGLSFGESRTAVLKSGLPDADGRGLENSEEVPVDFADRPPYVGFKGAGVILPRLEADGLPVETVNVEEVDVTVWRVNDRVLFEKRVSQGETSAQGDGIYLYGDEGARDVAVRVWNGKMPVETQPNAPVVTVFPLAEAIGTLKPGAYYVRVADAKELADNEGPPAASERWIIVTDLALTAFQGEQGLDVTVRSLQTALAAPGTRMQLIAVNNEVLAEKQADANGYVRFDVPLTRGEYNLSPKAVYAYGVSGDFAILDLTRSPVDLSSEDVGGRYASGIADVYMYTERGIYRPGETVHLTAMIRDREGRAITDRAGTLKVYRPNGIEAASYRFRGSESGAVLQDIELSKGAARGMWRASVTLDGSDETVGSVSFSVEDFVPQRIRVDLEADTETAMRAGETRQVEAEVRFLYGAPGAGLAVEGEARLEADPNPFPDFKGFRFGQFDESFGEQIIELPDTVADGAGKAVLRLSPEDRGTDFGRPLRLNLVVSGIEPGGRAVSDSVRIPYRPNDRYFGIKPDFEHRAEEGKEASFTVAAINHEGDGVAETMDWKVVEVDWNYDWYKDSSGEWRWRRSRYVRTVNEGRVTTGADGLAKISTDRLGWGDHRLILSRGDNILASYQFWSGWGGYSDDGVEAPDRVRVVGPESAPREGQSAQMTIIPPYDGQAQIVVATDKVISVEYRSVTTEGARISLPVTEEWGDGAYVMVSVYSPRDPVMQAKPRRAVGVAHVPLDMSRRIIDLEIEAPEVARPNRQQVITVDIGNGPREPVFLTLAAVDEGILRLTKFNSPDPVDWYFGKKQLQVSLYDDYGRLLDPNMGVPADVRSGGDQLGGEGLSVVPFKTVALFSGLVDVGRDGKAQVRFDLPQFNGELRLMAVAWTKTGVGSADRSMIVRDLAPTELSLPRFLAPGDTAFATASIDNVEAGSGQFQAEIDASAGIDVDAGNFSVNLQQGQRQDERIELTAQTEGINELSFSVSGPSNFRATTTYPIQTRSAFLPVTTVTSELMSAGASYSVPRDALASYVPGSGEVTVSFSGLPLDAGSLYASLSRYPYGCTEQTVSRAMPLLYSSDLAKLAGKEGGDREARLIVQEAIQTVLSRQSPDGAFGLWREGDRNASPWLGAYTTDFLVRAKAAGYAVPQEALDRAFGALRNVGSGEPWRIWGYDTDVWESRWHNDTQDKLMNRAMPYALYVLAKAGEVDVARLRYVHDRELDQLDGPLAKAQLGAALAYMGDRSRANSAFEAAVASFGYTNNGDYYQTPVRDIAGVLALAAEVEENDVVATASTRLGRDVPDPVYLSTQEKAFLLQALNAMTRGQPVPEIEVAGLPRGSNNDRRYLLSPEQVSGGVTFTYRGSAPVWRTVMTRGAPTNPPPAVSSELSVTKKITDLQGRNVNLGQLSQGDRLVVAITISPSERRTNPVVLADLLPAGFEIEAILRPDDGATRDRRYGEDGAFAFVGEIDQPKTAEARDDRFVAAIDVRENPVTLGYIVRAVTPGEFTMPGAVAEDMYRARVFGRSAPGNVVITARQ